MWLAPRPPACAAGIFFFCPAARTHARPPAQDDGTEKGDRRWAVLAPITWAAGKARQGKGGACAPSLRVLLSDFHWGLGPPRQAALGEIVLETRDMQKDARESREPGMAWHGRRPGCALAAEGEATRIFEEVTRAGGMSLRFHAALF